MHYIILTILPFIAILLESTLFHAVAFQGVIPDLLLIFVINYALLHGYKKGSIYGCLCGLMEDMYLGRFIGTNVLAKGITAFVVGKLQTSVFKDNVLVGVLGTILGTIINVICMTLLAILNVEKIKIDAVFAINIFLHLFYNTLIAAPVYIWYYRANSKGMLHKSREI